MNNNNSITHNSIITLSICAAFFFSAFSGQTLSKLTILLLLILFALIYLNQNSLIVRPLSQIEKPGIRALYAFILILLIGLVSSYISYRDITYTSMGFIVHYPILLILVTVLIGKKSYQSLIKIVLIVSVATSILSIAEAINYEAIPFVKNYVQLMVDAHEDNPLTASILSETGLRSFGLFQNALTNGMFISLALTILMAHLIHRKFSILGLLLLLIMIWAEVTTDTRNCFFVIAIGFVSLILFKLKAVRIFARKQPNLFSNIGLSLMLAGMMYVAVYFIYTGELLNADGKIDSIAARVITWTQVFMLYMKDADITNLLFGFGVIQWANAPYAKDLWAMDNIFVQLYMYAGFSGVCIFIYAWRSVTVPLIRKASYMDTYALISCSISFQFLFSGIFNSSFSIFPYTSTAWVLMLLGLAKRSNLQHAQLNAQ